MGLVHHKARMDNFPARHCAFRFATGLDYAQFSCPGSIELIRSEKIGGGEGKGSLGQVNGMAAESVFWKVVARVFANL